MGVVTRSLLGHRGGWESPEPHSTAGGSSKLLPPCPVRHQQKAAVAFLRREDGPFHARLPPDVNMAPGTEHTTLIFLQKRRSRGGSGGPRDAGPDMKETWNPAGHCPPSESSLTRDGKVSPSSVSARNQVFCFLQVKSSPKFTQTGRSGARIPTWAICGGEWMQIWFLPVDKSQGAGSAPIWQGHESTPMEIIVGRMPWESELLSNEVETHQVPDVWRTSLQCLS